MRAILTGCLALGWACVLVPAASATVYLSQKGSALYLSGEFEDGDEAIVSDYLKQGRNAQVRVVYLDSFGGSIKAGIRIGRLVRRAGLDTAVDADAARCDSACTLIFAGGVRRHYVNGAGVFEGTSARGGLGYHPAHSRNAAWTEAKFSDRGTAMMSRFYREMGQPGARDLMLNAGFTSMFRPSGATAMRLKIATSLAAPGY